MSTKKPTTQKEASEAATFAKEYAEHFTQTTHFEVPSEAPLFEVRIGVYARSLPPTSVAAIFSAIAGAVETIAYKRAAGKNA